MQNKYLARKDDLLAAYRELEGYYEKGESCATAQQNRQQHQQTQHEAQ
jgi:hypothetical protein